MIRLSGFTILSLLFVQASLFGQGMSYGKAERTEALGPDAPPHVEFVQNLGSTVPLDLTFQDSTNTPVTIREAIGGKPTIMVLVYHRCPRLCNEVLTGLMDSLNALKDRDPEFVAGQAFNVVIVSIDPMEGPLTLLAPARTRFHQTYDQRSDDTPGITFLTASHGQGTDLVAADATIKQLASAVGFEYTLRQRGRDYLYDEATHEWASKDGYVLGGRAKSYDYQHAAGIVFLSPEGKITRYLMGLNFNPTTLRRAVVEASDGTVGSLADKVSFYCFAYDPSSEHYAITMKALSFIAMPFALIVGYFAYRTIRGAMREKTIDPRDAHKTPGTVYAFD